MSIEPVNDPYVSIEVAQRTAYLIDPMIADPWLAPALCGMSIYTLFGDWRRGRRRAREIAALEQLLKS